MTLDALGFDPIVLAVLLVAPIAIGALGAGIVRLVALVGLVATLLYGWPLSVLETGALILGAAVGVLARDLRHREPGWFSGGVLVFAFLVFVVNAAWLVG